MRAIGLVLAAVLVGVPLPAAAAKDKADLGKRGNQKLAAGDYDGALADFQEVLRLDPADPAVHAWLGNAWQGKGELDRAIAEYTTAIDAGNREAQTYYNRAMTHSRKDEYELAIADYSAALAIEPDYPDA